jgi:hypothetical protein
VVAVEIVVELPLVLEVLGDLGQDVGIEAGTPEFEAIRLIDRERSLVRGGGGREASQNQVGLRSSPEQIGAPELFEVVSSTMSRTLIFFLSAQVPQRWTCETGSCPGRSSQSA